jgi:tetratricopeptide (TPR) repeat protein
MTNALSQLWLEKSFELITALQTAAVKDNHTLLLAIIGGALTFTMLADLRFVWRGSNDYPVRQRDGAYFTEKTGPVALHYERGQAFLDSGDTRRAIESFSKALRLNPVYAGALAGRALALFKGGDYENALADLGEALFLDPNDAKTFYLRGNILGARGDFAGAVADYDRALQIKPRQADILEARQRALSKLEGAGAYR